MFAPNASAVSVVGDFNGWDRAANPCERISGGIFEAFVTGVKKFDAYKFAVTGQNGKPCLKATPMPFISKRDRERPPRFSFSNGKNMIGPTANI